MTDALHLSENDALVDSNNPLIKRSKLWRILKKYDFVTIEVYKKNAVILKNQIKLVNENYINKEIEDLIVSRDKSIGYTLRKIQKNGYGTLFIVNDRIKLLGILTDGDIRKAIIKGASIKDSIKKYYNREVSFLPYNSNNQTIQNLLSSRIKIVPLVNNRKVVVDFATPERIKKYLYQSLLYLEKNICM